MCSHSKRYLAILLTFLCITNTALAGSVKSCETRDSDNGSFDYSDAPDAYGEACHDTNAWQQLGKAKIKNTDGEKEAVALQGDSGSRNDNDSVNRGWNAETDPNSPDTGDNGVSWRIQNEDATWTKFGRKELTQGQTVEFKFVVQRSTEGNHEYDNLKAWVDWNGNKSFDENSSEILVDAKWYKVADHGQVNNSFNAAASYNNDRKVLAEFHNETIDEINANYETYKNTVFNSVDAIAVFKVQTQIPLDAVLGNTWMRARVVCENSLTNHSENMNLIATGYQHQGEVEDYKLSIAHVPEPTSLIVFGSALLGLIMSRKKVK